MRQVRRPSQLMALLDVLRPFPAAMPTFFSPEEIAAGVHVSNAPLEEYPFSSLELSDYVLPEDSVDQTPAVIENSASPAAPAAAFLPQSFVEAFSAPPALAAGSSSSMSLPPLPRLAEGSRIAFRTKSEVDNLDDGFKWRKYGKKPIKNSPNPRNYYRCSTEGCSVKKRVERDINDQSYVITTYEGVHNHTSPGIVYYTTQDAVSGWFLLSGCQMPGPSGTASSSSNL
ncbi:putative WRKY transcription factor 51 [Apostasia shenzhenica]|uniref:Putative WRKY transcription factor 51 n=1 Tax=Apostasia shenzhenica TaxID=1088818 RepID=A0A2I0AP28_9ASPA|nr:putative WRKY transcription factor 51 [Apostasia shenzhenica]